MAQAAIIAGNTVGTAAVRIGTAAARGTAIILIDLYRAVLSPLLIAAMGPACRFEPSCSAYAREAIARHGIMAGGQLTLRRLAQCRPAGRWGHDPVPHERPRRLKIWT